MQSFASLFDYEITICMRINVLNAILLNIIIMGSCWIIKFPNERVRERELFFYLLLSCWTAAYIQFVDQIYNILGKFYFFYVILLVYKFIE